MDPGDAFSAANLFKWDPRATAIIAPPDVPSASAGDLEEMFEGYGVRSATAARMSELGFTASTLVGMTESELDDMMSALAHIFRWDLLVGERYGVKAAVRARRRCLQSISVAAVNALDALSQEGLSEEPVQQEREAAGSGGEPVAVVAGRIKGGKGKQNRRNGGGSCGGGSSSRVITKKGKKKMTRSAEEYVDADEQEDSDGDGESEGSGGGGCGRGIGERQREHPFIVTEPGEVARAKKNGLDYLFHLYDQCREFLLQVQTIAKEHGHKCPTKVTNQVFRYAKRAGASYINKPKMRHYVHCYALHCLDEEASNALRCQFKSRGENVGAWRQACYQPLVAIAARHGFDIDAVFNAHPRLAIWYVPTKLRQLCHLARSHAAAAAAAAAASSASALSGLPTVGGALHPPPSMY